MGVSIVSVPSWIQKRPHGFMYGPQATILQSCTKETISVPSKKRNLFGKYLNELLNGHLRAIEANFTSRPINSGFLQHQN